MAYEPKGIFKTTPKKFSKENYSYWKACMHIHVNSYDKDMCYTITQKNAMTLSHLSQKHYGITMIIKTHQISLIV